MDRYDDDTDDSISLQITYYAEDFDNNSERVSKIISEIFQNSYTFHIIQFIRWNLAMTKLTLVCMCNLLLIFFSFILSLRLDMMG